LIAPGGARTGLGVFQAGSMHGFQWTAGTVSLLPVSAGSRSAVYAAGPSGRSAGIVEATGGDTHAFTLSRGMLTELATLGGKNASARGHFVLVDDRHLRRR
jgi:uncharacterized membrane protein